VASNIDKKRELMAVAKRCFERGLQTGTGGNLSIRCDNREQVVIKPSGFGFFECNEENLLVVALDGTIIEGSGKPSKDMPFHLGIYRVRDDVNGIVHVHSPWATAWASVNQEIPCMTVHSRAKLGRIPVIPCGPDRGNQRPEDIVDAYRDAKMRALILEDHGSVGVGKTIMAAQHVVELIEETAQIAAVARTLGK
jgi:L-ribulose-5-phosphate 4-epimerase